MTNYYKIIIVTKSYVSAIVKQISVFYLRSYMPPTIAEKIAVNAFPPSVCPFLINTPAYQKTSAHDMHAIPYVHPSPRPLAIPALYPSFNVFCIASEYEFKALLSPTYE